jgi:transcriptional regulator with XRE-family HTH domain
MAAQHLVAWLREHEISQREFARRLNISQPFMNNLIAGRRTPTLELASTIENATNHVVKMQDWLAS